MIKMKKILLFFCLMFAIMQETKAIVPAIAVNNMKEQQKILDKKRNSIYNNGLIILNKEEKIQELLDNKKIPKFYLNNITAYRTIKDMVLYIREAYTEEIVEILYVEVIPMYDKVNVFIIYELKEKQKEIKKLEWHE